MSKTAGETTGERSAPPRRPCEGAVLVVEDDRLVRVAVRHYLESAGYRTLGASNFAGAIYAGAVSSNPIALLIVNVILPGPGGARVVEHVRRLHPSAGVLYISAHPRYLLLDTARILPADEVLEKPFAPEDLLAKVRAVIS